MATHFRMFYFFLLMLLLLCQCAKETKSTPIATLTKYIGAINSRNLVAANSCFYDSTTAPRELPDRIVKYEIGHIDTLVASDLNQYSGFAPPPIVGDVWISVGETYEDSSWRNYTYCLRQHDGDWLILYPYSAFGLDNE